MLLKVRMSHPRLGGRVIEVPASAVPVHEQSGWKVADGTSATGTRKPRSAAADNKRQRTEG